MSRKDNIPKYEYITVGISSYLIGLNQMGAQGWQLVHIDDSSKNYLFMRPIPKERKKLGFKVNKNNKT